MTAHSQRLGRIVLTLVLSMTGSYASALAFIAVQTWTLPPLDGAYGRGLSETLLDPFVIDVAWFCATVAGLFVFLIALWALRGRNLLVSFAISLAAALTAIASVTPLGGWLGILAGLLATVIALAVRRRSRPELRGLALY